jgi:hypothetical protein
MYISKYQVHDKFIQVYLSKRKITKNCFKFSTKSNVRKGLDIFGADKVQILAVHPIDAYRTFSD